ncbi:MAG: hypothetical protein WA294_04475 [Acidobacteriaceae bacterium]
MRMAPRLALRLVLVLVALCLLWFRLMPRLMQRGRSRGADDVVLSTALNQPGSEPAPADAYPIYSALYQTPPPGSAGEPLVFAKESRTEIPQIVNGSCLRPSNAEERELASSFDAANAHSREWQPQFDIPAGYRLLSSGEVDKVFACFARHDRTSAQCSAYAQVQHIRYLGVPGLDASGTHALVSVIKSCGMQCGGGGIFEAEKDGATWKRMPETDFTRDCSWVY